MSIPVAYHWISVDESVFSEPVVMKAVYWLSGRFTVEVRRRGSPPSLQVGVASPTGSWAAEAAAEIESKLRRDLIDFRTREIVHAETRAVRELLIAKAFDNADEVPASAQWNRGS